MNRAMDEHLQEQASSYALGALPENERAAFEQALARDPELQALVREFQDALGEAARKMPPVSPPPALKARVMAKVAAIATSAAPPADETKTVSFPPWIPWLVAASLAVASLWLVDDRAKLRAQRNTLEEGVRTLVAEADDLREQARSAGARAAELQVQAADLEQVVAGVRAELAAARSAADLATMQVARLTATPNGQAQFQAVSLWNGSTKQGVLLVENLPVPPPGKTYELWVIDPDVGVPVSAGIFSTDAEGRGRMVFRPQQGVQKAGTIAISIEPAGGSPNGRPDIVIMAGGATQL